MLHSLKKKTVGLTVKADPEPDSYAEAKDRLARVRSTLEHSTKKVDEAEASWGNLIREAQQFQQKLHDGYPPDDHVKVLLKGAEEHMEKLHGEYTTAVDPSAGHRNVMRNVKAYLGEIDVVQKEYKRVADAKREFEIYNSKVESLDKHKKEGDKKSRNLDKLESARIAYDSVLKSTMNQIDSVYKKAPSMYTAVYVAYWLAQSRLQQMVDRHFKPSISYAQRHEIGSTVAQPAMIPQTNVQKKATGSPLPSLK